MSYLSIEEYHVRFERGEQRLDGKLWIRPDQEWEVEVEESQPRLTAATDEPGAGGARGPFTRMVEALGAQGVRPRVCGTCAHFRRSPQSDADGWLGYCSFREGAAEVPSYPGRAALLTPDCHAYAPDGTGQPPADPDALSDEERDDPNMTSVLPAAAAAAPRERAGIFGKLRAMVGLKRAEPEMVRAGAVERPGGQPCPACGTRMTNRASVANADSRGEERVLSVWRCPHCFGNYLDDWFEAYIGSRARDAERLYVVPPVEANEGAAIVVHCPRPDVKGCTCIANQHFDRWGDALQQTGRRIKHRESVVSL